MQDVLFQQVMLISSCLASISLGLDLALKAEHKCEQFLRGCLMSCFNSDVDLD